MAGAWRCDRVMERGQGERGRSGGEGGDRRGICHQHDHNLKVPLTGRKQLRAPPLVTHPGQVWRVGTLAGSCV